MEEFYVERFIEQKLREWKAHRSESVLEVTGCRQVGKTTTVLHFARENYAHVLYVNAMADDLTLLENADYNSVVGVVQAFFKKRECEFVNDRSTVLIVDEVQESRAIYEKIRVFKTLKCDFIVTGSNLAKTKNYFQPAGDIYAVRMYPLSYEEYLNYYGAYAYYCNSTVEEICGAKYDWFKRVFDVYLEVGGYPSVFIAYVQGRGIREKFAMLVDSFKSEFRVNTGDPSDYDKIDGMFRAICKLLCNEKKGNPKVVESVAGITCNYGSKRVSKQECSNMLAWLSAARIVNYCDRRNLDNGEVYDAERVYFEDVGLFGYLCDLYQVEKSAVRGALMETFVYKQLAEKEYSSQFYDVRPQFATMGEYELDFMVTSREDGKRYGVEVKSGGKGGKSLRKLLDVGKIDYGVYARAEEEAGYCEGVYTVPLFLLNKFEFSKGGSVAQKGPERIRVFS